uniref:Uncharacterized protein n=1 Tax=Kalanchoe fedtschenkoi TaxID=63787 RepID=A0A7N1A872_KALFE
MTQDFLTVVFSFRGCFMVGIKSGQGHLLHYITEERKWRDLKKKYVFSNFFYRRIWRGSGGV